MFELGHSGLAHCTDDLMMLTTERAFRFVPPGITDGPTTLLSPPRLQPHDVVHPREPPDEDDDPPQPPNESEPGSSLSAQRSD
jgi:hypothetical protein